MAADTVQQIKDRITIIDVVSGYVKLERSGTSLRARCPFHAERTPSFHVSAERGTYHCFGCGVGGDIFSFVEAVEGVDFKGALKILAEKAGVPLVYSRGDNKGQQDERDRLFEMLETATIFYSSRLTDASTKYLNERGITDQTLKEFRVGWAGKEWSDLSDHLKKRGFGEKEMLDAGLSKKNEKGQLSDKFRNRIMFPIADPAGRVVGFSGRVFGEDASPDAPKYLNSPETPLFHKSRILYGFDKAKLAMRKLNCAVLVEGQMDLLASHQAGWANTLAVSGTAFTPEHAALIKRMTENLILALDADEAGIKAAARSARSALAAGLNVKVAKLPAGMDPADLVLKEGADAWKDAIKSSKDIITFLLDTLEERMPQKDRFRRAVETAVLPFLSDVQSPIAREQYVHEIASRLGVSEGAVSEALDKLPRMPSEPPRQQEPASVPPPLVGSSNDRTRHAFAMLLWQKSLPKASIDVGKYEKSLAEAIGQEEFAELETLPDADKERMRFGVERLYGPEATPDPDLRELISLLVRERLASKLYATTTALKRAESEGNSELAATLMEESRLLTTQIAKMHEKE